MAVVIVAVSASAVIAILHSCRYMVDRALDALLPILPKPTAARLSCRSLSSSYV
jgi:hypothetical protein